MSWWTEEKIVTLKQLWAEGKSSKVIGEIMGATKNAIIGKVHRLNLHRSHHPRPEQVVNLQRAIEARKREALRNQARATARREKAEKDKLEREAAQAKAEKERIERGDNRVVEIPKYVAPVSHGVFSPREKMIAWTQRGQSRCAFPLGTPDRPANQECCGEKIVPTQRYCDEHAAIMFRPPEERSRANRMMRPRANMLK